MTQARSNPDLPADWLITAGTISYDRACELMAERVDAILAAKAPELVWLLEHPPLYTAGTSAKAADLLDPDRFPVYRTGRGGQYTYHGPGQRVGYVMLDVGRRFGDVRAYVRNLEDWLIDALARLGVKGERRDGNVGIWVAKRDGGRAKIAAIGVRLRKWVSSHGFSLNVAPQLDHFTGIVPCGIADDGVTSLADLGVAASFADVDRALQAAFIARFGAVRTIPVAGHLGTQGAEAGFAR
jgi:lipoyl(octanoyl) transferase